jgi:hypothetical protein
MKFAVRYMGILSYLALLMRWHTWLRWPLACLGNSLAT